jgi:hypothetical protein
MVFAAPVDASLPSHSWVRGHDRWV